MRHKHLLVRELHLATWAAIVLVMLAPSRVGAAQSAPPVQGTIALEGTMKKVYGAVNVVVVTTIDGVEHVYRFAKDLVVHGGKHPGVDALKGMEEGSTVVVHYTVEGTEQEAREIDVVGGEGLEITEGKVTHVDRRHRKITVQYDNGRIEIFQLTERAAAEASPGTEQAALDGTRVAIYYRDEHGQKVAHFFRRIPK